MTSRLTYTVDEAAALLGIGRNHAYAAIQRGEIPHIRVGRRILIPRDKFTLSPDAIKKLWEEEPKKPADASRRAALVSLIAHLDACLADARAMLAREDGP